MSNVVELKTRKFMTKLIVKGKTVKPLSFFVWDIKHTIPIGTDIIVDLDNMIARVCQQEHYTNIEIDEFEVLNQN